MAEEKSEGLEALYGTHGFLCEVLRLRGDIADAQRHGRRAVELAMERGSPFSRVEAAVFLGAVDLAVGDIDGATSTLEAALELARTRRTALWYEPRILATLADARLAAGDRAGARALITEARESLARGRGWRLSACDVELARVRLLAAEPAADRTAIEERARLPGDASRPTSAPCRIGRWRPSSAPVSLQPPSSARAKAADRPRPATPIRGGLEYTPAREERAWPATVRPRHGSSAHA